MTTHFNRGKAGTGETIPLCRQKASNGKDWAKSDYTRDQFRVTCKKCLKRLAEHWRRCA